MMSLLDGVLEDPSKYPFVGTATTTPEPTTKKTITIPKNPDISCASGCSNVRYPGDPIKYGSGILAIYSFCDLDLGRLPVQPRKMRIVLKFDGGVIHVKVSEHSFIDLGISQGIKTYVLKDCQSKKY